MNEIPPLREFTAASFKIGCLGFGGPAGQIALMHRAFVDEKKWIGEEAFQHALNFCMLLPGPEAQQLATYIGWRLHGVGGGLIAGVLFVLPGALVMLGLSILYVYAGQALLVEAAFYGIRAAVVALIAEALLRVGKRALKTPAHWLIAAASFLALWLGQIPFPLVILAAGVLGALAPRANVSAAAPSPEPVRAADALKAAAFWGALWLTPPLTALLVLSPAHTLAQIGALFSTLSMVTFGGAYATLAYLAQQAVDTQHWLSAAQMIEGLGLAETTPGPLVLVNQFVGFLAGWNSGGLGLAFAGAAMATWCTFAPSFVWIFAGAPFAERLRANARASAILHAISAATLGVIAHMAAWFTLHVLFAEIGRTTLAPGVAPLWPELSSFDAVAAGLCLAVLALAFGLRLGPLALVAAAIASGLAAHGLGLV
ncbi:MAG: chromate efflux transporter [Terricaulis sp.]